MTALSLHRDEAAICIRPGRIGDRGTSFLVHMGVSAVTSLARMMISQEEGEASMLVRSVRFEAMSLPANTRP
jgi:hypothetical protein